VIKHYDLVKKGALKKYKYAPYLEPCFIWYINTSYTIHCSRPLGNQEGWSLKSGRK